MSSFVKLPVAIDDQTYIIEKDVIDYDADSDEDNVDGEDQDDDDEGNQET